jgi:hypothetical protein
MIWFEKSIKHAIGGEVVLGVRGAVVKATFVAIRASLKLRRGKLCHACLQLCHDRGVGAIARQVDMLVRILCQLRYHTATNPLMALLVAMRKPSSSIRCTHVKQAGGRSVAWRRLCGLALGPFRPTPQIRLARRQRQLVITNHQRCDGDRYLSAWADDTSVDKSSPDI